MYNTLALSATRDQGVPTMESIVRHTEGRIREGNEESPAFTVGLRYDIANPHAVDVEFPSAGSDPNIWTIAVSLFYNDTFGPQAPIGEQGVAVTFSLSRNEVAIHLRAPEGNATVILPADEVLCFAKKVQGLVTPEDEEIARNLLAAKFSTLLAQQ